MAHQGPIRGLLEIERAAALCRRVGDWRGAEALVGRGVTVYDNHRPSPPNYIALALAAGIEIPADIEDRETYAKIRWQMNQV